MKRTGYAGVAVGLLLFLASLCAGSGLGMGRGGIRVVHLNGVERWTVMDGVERLGLATADQGATLTNPRHRFAFNNGSRELEYNGGVIWLHHGAVLHQGRMTLAKADWHTTLAPLARPEGHLTGTPTRVVVLDPGHGGNDEGATSGGGMKEKALALEVAAAVRDRLRAKGITVYLTRETDVYIALGARPAVAAGKQADLMVSIHFNQASNPDAAGVETFVLTAQGERSTSDNGKGRADSKTYMGNRHDGANTILGYCLQHRLVKTLRAPDRGIRRARFVVLREAPCPAALVECGFLSNAAEAGRIASPHYRVAMADGFVEGILDLYRLWDLAASVTP